MSPNYTEPALSGTVVPLPARQPGAAVRTLATDVLRHRTGAVGLCSDTGDTRYYPAVPRGRAARRRYAEYARARCSGCPVIGECLELALRIEAVRKDSSHGVWGATAPWERRALLRERDEAARPQTMAVSHG